MAVKIIVALNDRLGLKPEQATTMLIDEAARAGCEVWLTGVADLFVEDRPGQPAALLARAARVEAAASREALVAASRQADEAVIALDDAAMILIRTNPGREPERWAIHELALELCAMARDRGVRVCNDPDGLRRGATKLYLSRFDPALRPDTLVASRPEALRRFVMEAPGRCVLKPVRGSRGQDVFMVDPAHTQNLSQLLDVLTRDGRAAMAQGFVPEADQGDVRLVLLDGALLEVDGHPCAVRRVPGPGEFRSNVHAGGHAVPAEVTDAMRHIVATLGPQLRADGLRLVGVDLIGHKIVELNVFSTGGLLDAERFTGAPFAAHAWRALAAGLRG